MVRCIQGFVVKDAISFEFVRVVPIVKVRFIQRFVYRGFVVSRVQCTSMLWQTDIAEKFPRHTSISEV